MCGGCSCIPLFSEKRKEEEENGAWQERAALFCRKQLEGEYFLLPGFLEGSKEKTGIKKWLEQCLIGELPVFAYLEGQDEEERKEKDKTIAESGAVKEGNDEEQKNIDEAQLDYEENALHIENSILQKMERENGLHNVGTEAGEEEKGENAVEEEKSAEGGGFQISSYPAYTYDWSEQWDYEALVSNFYAVDSATVLKEEYVTLDKLLYQDLQVEKEGEGPQILIYHTHASEAFADSVEGDASTTIVGAGERLAELLEEKYGFRVLHHTGVYDEVREDAYANALPKIEEILKENPSIEVVIDLHRDAVSGDRKLVMELKGRPTARFMFFNGLSYGRKSGEIAYLENPYIQDNLAFSFQAQVAANEYYPGIARKIYLKAYRYNMHLKKKSMLIELGAQNNTVEEIMNACEPLAHILSIVLDGDL